MDLDTELICKLFVHTICYAQAAQQRSYRGTGRYEDRCAIPASADPSMFQPMLVTACFIPASRGQPQVLTLPACFPVHATKERADGQQVAKSWIISIQSKVKMAIGDYRCISDKAQHPTPAV